MTLCPRGFTGHMRFLIAVVDFLGCPLHVGIDHDERFCELHDILSSGRS